VQDDQRDPEMLRRLLIGGRSVEAKRRYPGLRDRACDRVRQLYALPRPQGMPTGSIIRATGRATGEPAQDPDELRRYLEGWLGREATTVHARLGSRTNADLLCGLVVRATGRAARGLDRRRARGRAVIRAHELAMFLLGWLKATCDHARARGIEGGRGRECPDCGMVMIG